MTPDAIRKFRKSKGLSQEELGKLCGVGKSAVSQWESGSNVPTGSAKILLEEFLNGLRCIVPLTQQEEKLLDENVQKGNFATREDYLAASLVHLIRHGGFDVPVRNQVAAPVKYPTLAQLPKVAEDEPEYRIKQKTGEAGPGN